LPRALLSVSDKTGLSGFARGLQRLGYELYATGSTLKAIVDGAVDARSVTDLTGFPEMMDGRIKTLHPGVHAGLLARRDKPEHMEALREHDLKEIDLVCCNLYPFVETVTQPGVRFEDAIEQIDIGGPAMIRAAAKNHESVVVVVRPERYTEILTTLRSGGPDKEMRRRLAAEAYAHTASYDAWIAAYMHGGAEAGFPQELPFAGRLTQSLKYGENEHQRAAFYRYGPDPGGLGGARQLQGKELGFNNIQDAAAAIQLVSDFDLPATAIIKHMNPCGLAVAGDIATAYRLPYDCDPTSAFGGIVAVKPSPRSLDRGADSPDRHARGHRPRGPRREPRGAGAPQGDDRAGGGTSATWPLRLRRAVGSRRVPRPGVGPCGFRSGGLQGGHQACAQRGGMGAAQARMDHCQARQIQRDSAVQGRAQPLA